MECSQPQAMSFYSQDLSLLSSTKQSNIPVSQVSQSDTRLVKAARAAPKPPLEKALQSADMSPLYTTPQQREPRNFGQDKHTWNTYTATLDHGRKPSGKQQHCRSGVILKSQVLLFVTAGALLTRHSTDRTQVTDQQASQ